MIVIQDICEFIAVLVCLVSLSPFSSRLFVPLPSGIYLGIKGVMTGSTRSKHHSWSPHNKGQSNGVLLISLLSLH